MTFMSPILDIGFKKLFANKEKPEIVIAFLNSILGLPEGKKITQVTLNDPNNTPDTCWDKSSIVDVSCIDQSGSMYIVEMQCAAQSDYAQRCQYYSALALVRQMKKSCHYHELKPVVFVGVMNL